MAKIILNPVIQGIRGKIGDVVYRVSPTGKQTAMKAPDTPALARRCKCVQGEVEQGAEGKPQALQAGNRLRQGSHGRPESE